MEEGEKVEKKVVKKQVKKKEEKIGDALMKVALGYQIAEVTEEYAEVNGELKLTKRKKTKKDVPPDLKAVQLLLSSGESAAYGEWTDEALQAEKERLLGELKKQAASVLEQVSGSAAGAEDSVKKKSSVKKAATKKTVKKSNAKTRGKGTRAAVKKGGIEEDGAKGV